MHSNVTNTSEKQIHQNLLPAPVNYLDVCAVPVILWQKNGKMLYANEAAAEFFEYSKEQITDHTFSDFFSSPSLYALFFIDASGYPQVVEGIQVVKKSGSLIECHIRVKYMGEGDSGVICTTLIPCTAGGEATEKDLTETASGWRLALEGSNQGIWEWDIKNSEVHYSLLSKKLLGLNNIANDNLFLEWQNRVHPDDKEKVATNLNQYLQGINPRYENVFRLKINDGLYKWILSRGSIIARSAEGKPERMMGTHTDITERIELEENYKLLFYHIPLPMWTFDQDTYHILEVNDRAVESYGYSREEFLQKKVWNLHPEEDEEAVKELILQNKLKTRTDYEQLRHRKKNGELMFVNIIRHLFQYNYKKLAIVISTDVTEKVKAEEQLQRSKDNYRLLFTENPSLSWMVSNEDLSFLEVNDAVIRHYGYSREEFMSMTLYNVVHPDEWKPLQAALKKPTPKRSYEFDVCRHVKKNGDIIFVDVKVNVLKYDGKTVRLAVMNDITARLAAEENLRLSNEQFRFVSKATSDVIWDCDLKKHQTHFSDSYEKVFGWSLPEDRVLPNLIGESRCHAQDIQKIRESFNRILKQKSKNIWEEEFRYQKSNGAYADVSCRGIVLRNQEGEVERIIGAMQDISGSKYAQRLQALELKVFEQSSIPGTDFHKVLKTLIAGFEEIHEQATAAVSLCNLNNRWEIVAPGFSVEERYRIKQFTERKSAGIEVKKSIKESIIVTTPESEDWKPVHGDKAPYGHVCWTVPVQHQNGRLLGFFFIFHRQHQEITGADYLTLSRLANVLCVLITHHFSVEQMKISNERYNNVLRATNDMIWDWNLLTGVFYRNTEGMRRVYGIQDEQAIKKFYNWLKRIHPDDHKKLQKVINDILRKKNQDWFELEYRFKNDEGHYSFIYDRAIVVRNRQGRPIRLIGAAQNITDRKRLEQELMKKELDKQKNISQATIDTQEQERREIGKELHDNINQVLTTTKLYLDLSLNNPDLTQELIRKSSDNIIYVINQIRQLSRSLMDPSLGDLGLVDAINDLIRSITITGKLHISLQVCPEIDDLLQENKKLMIYRILQEALTNVIKHAQANSVHVHFEKNSDQINLTIADDGIGFRPAMMKRGAGLKNIQNRVYLANGKSIIDTAPGKGCKIIINFPINTNKHS